MASPDIAVELTWLCSLLFFVVITMLIVTCVCFKDRDKSPEYGTAGRLSITRDSPVFQHQPRNGTLRSSKHKNANTEEINLKRNSWTVKDRALPEIPGSTPMGRSSSAEGGSLSSSASGHDHVKVKGHNKAPAPKPPGGDLSKVFPMNGAALLPAADGASGITVTITVNDKTQIINNGQPATDRGSKPKMPPAESVPGTSSGMVVLKKVEKVGNSDVALRRDSNADNFYDTVPDNPSDRGSQSTSMSSSPVCIKIRSSAPSSEDGNSSTLSASLAVAGAIPSSDIPYMTPPLPHNLPQPVVDEEAEIGVTSGRSEVPYTVISVREPLARVREITMRRQRAVMQQNPEESEDHYAMVPEEEQMYAEIGSGHESGNSSVTYAHIEPRELPPVPPTVESLKSVAHAHSRQASTVSTCSLGSTRSNPGDASPPPHRTPSTSLYSTVEKGGKQRKTIHLGEGVSLASHATDKKKRVEDMYAKVRKKRVELSISTPDDAGYQGVSEECMTPPPSPWASTTPPAPPPIAGRMQVSSLGVGTPSQHVRRHSADPNLPEVVNENRVFAGSTTRTLPSGAKNEPDYEKIYNEDTSSCYEKIEDSVSEAAPSWRNNQPDPAYPGYESVKDQDEDSLDPNYEVVVRSGSEHDPGYERVRRQQFDDSDSNSDYTVVKLDAAESGYERVKNLVRSESDAADPGYERIKNLPRAGSDATDPGYERVRSKTDDPLEPGYESVQRSDSDTDPGYEVVRQNRSFNSRYSGTPVGRTLRDRGVVSTVLFVSGCSDARGSGDSDEQLSGSSDPQATFL